MTLRRPPRRSHQALALEPRILLDAAATATAEKVVAATDKQAGMAASGVEATVSIKDTDGQQNVGLFSGARITADSSNQALTTLVVTVNTTGSNQALVIDGTTIALQNSAFLATANNGYTYKVTVDGQITTISLALNASAANTPADVAKLVNGIQYSVLDNRVTSQTITVNLASLSDTDDKTTLDISSRITVTSEINVAPHLISDGGLTVNEHYSLSDLGSVRQVTYDSAGKFAYVAGEKGLSVFSVDSQGRLTLLQNVTDVSALGGVSHMVLSGDGKSIYTVNGSDSDEHIHELNVGSDGKLTYVGKFDSGNGRITGNLAASADGTLIYAGSQWNALVVYHRDTTTGALTFAARPSGDDHNGDRNGTVTVNGNYVYVLYTTGANELKVFQQNSNGSLKFITSTVTGPFGFDVVNYAMLTSADGKYVFIGDPNNNTLQVYQFSGSTLTQLSNTTVAGLDSLALSHDGTQLYAAQRDGTVSAYTVAADGTLALTSSRNIGSTVTGLGTSPDGLQVVAVGDQLSRLSSIQNLNLGQPLAFAGGLTLSDSNNNALASGSGDYKGSSLTVSSNTRGGNFGFIEGNGLTYANGVISYNGQVLANLSSNGDSMTLAFTGTASTALANQVVHQLSYSVNDGAIAAGTRVQLTVTSSDGALNSNTVSLLLRTNTIPLLNTDAATGYSLGKLTSETPYTFTLLKDLFRDADGDVLTWSVSGLPTGLTFDPTTRTITGSTTQTGTFNVTVSAVDPSGGKAQVVLTLDVEQIANRAPQINDSAAKSLAPATASTAYSVTLDPALFRDPDAVYGDTLTWSVSGLPQGMTFDAKSHTISGNAAMVGTYTVTVTVTDAAGSNTHTDLTLRVITPAESANRPPQILPNASSLSYSSDGTLSGYSYYVNSIKLSDDGKTLVVAGSEERNGNGTTHLSVYHRDTTTGALTPLQNFVQGTVNDGDDSNGIEVDGLTGLSSVTFSSDGKQLFVAGYTAAGSDSAYTISVFSVSSGKDALQLVGHVADVSDKVLELRESQDGKTLYALSGGNLYAYTVNGTGALTLLGSYANNYHTAVAFQVDQDGSVYVLSGSRLTVYTANGDGSLTFVGQMTRAGATLTYTDSAGNATTVTELDNGNAFNGSTALAVSSAHNVYVVTSNGFLTTFHYDRAANQVTLIDASDATTPFDYQMPSAVALSADGTAVYVTSGASGKMILYSVASNGAPVQQSVFYVDGGATKLAISKDGKSVYGGTDRFFSPDLRIITAGGARQAYTEGSTQPITGQLTLSDADYDALAGGAGNYKGASILIGRSGGLNASDSFGFTDANGLTLNNGKVSLNGTEIATLTSEGGKLTIIFTADTSTATANLVLKQITYGNSTKDPGSTIDLTVSLADQYTSTSMTLQLVVATVNDAPTLATHAGSVTYSAGGKPIKLFDGTAIDTIEHDQTVTGLTLTVSGLTDGDSEHLSIGGVDVVLSDGTTSSGTISDANGNSYSFNVSVTVSNGIATVAITADGLPVNVANTLVDSLSYANNAANASVGARTVTLTAITDNGGTSNGGVDTSTLNAAAIAQVTLTNQAPVVSADASNTQFVEKGAASSLFSKTQIDTGESGQAISNITLKVAGVADGASETLNLDGTAIALIAGSGTTTHGYTYTVTIEGTTATVTLASSEGISTAAAATLINDIRYANTSADPTAGSRAVTLTGVQDDGGTQHDGKDTATLAITAQVTVVPVNDAPLLQGSAQSVSYSTSGSRTSLFHDIAIQTVEANQAIKSISFSVTGIADAAKEVLIVDGTSISLVPGSGSTAHYTYTVTTDGSTVTLTVSSRAGINTTDAATLINQTTYSNQSNTQTAGIRSISVSVQDDGGTANGGVDRASLNAQAQVDVITNHAPTLSASPADSSLGLQQSLNAISGLGTLASSALSQDGGAVYAVDASGNLAVLSRNASTGEMLRAQTLRTGLGSASEVVISADGRHVYVLGNAGNAVAVFSVDTSGTVVQGQTLAVDHVVSLSASSNGSALYVVDGNYSGLKVYSLASDGQYQLSQSLASSTSSEPYLFSAVAVKAVGDYLYVVTNPAASNVENTLILYRIAGDGSLSAAAYLRDGSNGVVLGDAVGVSVTQDGGTVYIASATGVSQFSFDNSTQTLTYLGTISGLSNVSDVATSRDGSTLYVTSNDGSVARYAASTGTFTLLQTLSGNGADGTHVSTGDNGSVLLSNSKGLSSLHDGITPDLGLPYIERGSIHPADRVTLHDADYDALNNGAGNYKGAHISLSRSGGASSEDTFGFTAANGLSLSDGVISQNGTAIARFETTKGSLTVTFIGDTSTATANAVLRQISYQLASADPASQVHMILQVADAYDSSASTTFVLNVTAVNDAPTLSTSAANLSWKEGSAAATLFTDTKVSTVEAGQAIQQLTLQISGLADGNAEALTVDGVKIALVDGSGKTAHGYDYRVTLHDGVATLVISSSTGISNADTASLVNGLRYANSSQDPTGGSREITLTTLQDNGGTHDGGEDTTTLAVTASVLVVPVNDPPTLSSTPTHGSFIAGGNGSPLFSGTQISTIEAGQSITGLGLTVSGVRNVGEALLIDGTQVSLQNGFSATTRSGINIIVSLSDGTASIRLTSAGISTAAAQALVDGMTYNITGDTAGTGTRTITLTDIQDSGGSEHSALSVTAQVDVLNSAPLASDRPAQLADAVNRQPYNATLDARWFSDANGDTLTWQVSGLPTGLSFDARTLTISGTPQINGSFTLQVSVTDSSGASASRTVTLNVARPGGQPTLPLFTPVSSGVTAMAAAAGSPGQVFDAFAVTLPTLAQTTNSRASDARAERWDVSQSLATGRATIASQLSEATTVMGDHSTSTVEPLLSLRGNTLVGQLSSDSTVRLPGQLPDGSRPERVQLASGLPLPNWIRFEPGRGYLHVEQAPLARLGTLRLTLIGRAANGQETRTPVELHAPSDTEPARVQSHDALPTAAPTLPGDAPSALLEEARHLLESLAGLPPLSLQRPKA